jgi:CheY-like chemotaxis protein
MKTLLVVEDEVIVAMELVDRLEAMGYRVLGPASGGREAVELAAASRPDAVLMDVGLRDDVNGIEAARRIRAFSSAPIIFLTAYADGPLLVESAAVPFSFQLSKLFDDRDLENILARALEAGT